MKITVDRDGHVLVLPDGRGGEVRCVLKTGEVIQYWEVDGKVYERKLSVRNWSELEGGS